MPGVIVHLSFALLSVGLLRHYNFDWEYAWAMFIGNFMPDVFIFGISAIKQGIFHPDFIIHDSLFKTLVSIFNSYANWFSLGFFIFGMTLMLYHFHILKKRKMEEYDELFLFLLFGIIIHLILDVLIMENNMWW